MRIAFYAPMKSPDHPEPSGDRTMARLLLAALRSSGHAIDLASRLRSFDAEGDFVRQARIATLGRKIAERLIRRWRDGPADAVPDLWFTYHLYHKAPDWLGPRVSAALDIPYVVAEASHAAKQANGAWGLGHRAAARAIAQADLVIGLNPADAEGIRSLVADPARLIAVAPFIDSEPFEQARQRRDRHRLHFCGSYGIAPEAPLLLSVAMMRSGDKLASYQLLAAALATIRIRDRPWRLLIVGDGPARVEVRQAFAALGGRVSWLGLLDEQHLPAVYAAADLFVWPAIGEAWGMALLEAQAAGLSVVAGRSDGVANVVAEGESGRLVPIGDVACFAEAITGLLDTGEDRRRMARAGPEYVRSRHGLAAAAATLDAALQGSPGVCRMHRCLGG